MARAWQRWHQLGGKVRPVLGDVCLVGKGRRPAAAVGWDSKPLPRRFGGRGPRLECLMTWGSCIPALTARAGEDRRGPAVPMPCRPSADQRGTPAWQDGWLLVIRRWPDEPRRRPPGVGRWLGSGEWAEGRGVFSAHSPANRRLSRPRASRSASRCRSGCTRRRSGAARRPWPDRRGRGRAPPAPHWQPAHPAAPGRR